MITKDIWRMVYVFTFGTILAVGISIVTAPNAMARWGGGGYGRGRS